MKPLRRWPVWMCLSALLLGSCPAWSDSGPQPVTPAAEAATATAMAAPEPPKTWNSAAEAQIQDLKPAQRFGPSFLLKPFPRQAAFAADNVYYSDLHSANYITKLVVDGQIVWAATNNGVKFYHKPTRQWGYLGAENGLPSTVIQDMLIHRGFLWLATRDGLVRVNRETGEARRMAKANGLLDDSILSLAASGNTLCVAYGRVEGFWSGGANSSGLAAVSAVNIRTGLIRHYHYTGALKDDGVLKTLVDGRHVWAIHAKQVSRLDTDTNRIELPESNGEPVVPANQYFNSAAALAQDDQHVWVAGGTMYYGSGNAPLMQYDKLNQAWTVKYDRFTYSLARGQGVLWTGSSFNYDNSSELVLQYQKDNDSQWKEALYLKQGLPTCIAVDRKTTWVGTTRGIVRYQPKPKQAVVFTTLPGSVDFSCLAGKDGRLYLGGNRLFRYEVSSRELQAVGDDPVQATQMVLGKRGNLWITSYRYDYDADSLLLLDCDPATGQCATLVTVDYQTMDALGIRGRAQSGFALADDGESLWTGLKHLRRYDYARKRWHKNVQLPGSQPGQYNALRWDGEALWAATDTGLYCRRQDQWHRVKAGNVSFMDMSAHHLVCRIDSAVWRLDRASQQWFELPPFPEELTPAQFLALDSGQVLVVSDNARMLAWSQAGWNALENQGRIVFAKDEAGRLWAGIADNEGSQFYRITLNGAEIKKEALTVQLQFQEQIIPADRGNSLVVGGVIGFND